MLSTVHKANILRKAGYDVPSCPGDGLPQQAGQIQMQAGSPAPDMADWGRVIDAIYADYVTARAARSLRDAEEAHQAAVLHRPRGFSAFA